MMYKLINESIRSTLFIYIFYLLTHLVVDSNSSINRLYILLILFVVNLVFNIIRFNLTKSNRHLNKFEYIISHGVLGFGLNWFIIMFDFMNTNIIISIIISALAGVLFSSINLKLIKNKL